MRIDAHQHVWTEPLVAALSRRSSRPRIRRRSGGWWLEVAGEAPSLLRAAPDDVEARAALVREDGAARALVALSPALKADAGIIAAYDEGIVGLPGVFGAWGAIDLREHDASAVHEPPPPERAR